MKTIDGRKAEIINAGQWYNSYTGFANKHGYLDAAYRYPSVDPRVEPKDGDVVTLLVAGQHEWETDGTLWIVEAANGDRHIISEKGLRILSDQQATIDGLTETVANLARRLAKAETQLRVAREDIVLIEEGVSEDIRKLEAKVADLQRLEESRKASPVETKPLTRDEVVEKAKADTVYLTKKACAGSGTPLTDRVGSVSIKFRVDRKKKTIVAIAELRYFPGHITARGIAKCAPGDCFNVHIGKAVALRRALGFEVPTEYVNTPQPTEPRVGDIVTWEADFAHYLVINEENEDNLQGAWCFDGTSKWVASADTLGYALILDDSRDGLYGEVYSE